jgi:hypothetical protein
MRGAPQEVMGYGSVEMSNSQELLKKYGNMSVPELQQAFIEKDLYDQTERPLINSFLEHKLLDRIGTVVGSLADSSRRMEVLTWALLALTVALGGMTAYQIFGPEKALPHTGETTSPLPLPSSVSR